MLNSILVPEKVKSMCCEGKRFFLEVPNLRCLQVNPDDAEFEDIMIDEEGFQLDNEENLDKA